MTDEAKEGQLYLAGYLNRYTYFKLYISDHNLSKEDVEMLIGKLREEHDIGLKKS